MLGWGLSDGWTDYIHTHPTKPTQRLANNHNNEEWKRSLSTRHLHHPIITNKNTTTTMPKRTKAPPPGYEEIEPIIQALENELRDKVKESPLGKRNTESMWPVLQINWQRSRYVYDMYYTHQRITKKVYEYCLRNKIADANLIAKWKKPGYERLCSTHVINPANYKFGTTSICRVPMKDRGPEQKTAQDPTVSLFFIH